MQVIERSALLPYSSDVLFDLVNDVESYPKYLSGCDRVVVHERTDTHLEASLFISKAGINMSWRTRNELSRPERMEMRLVDGPFKHFKGVWQFHQLNEQATKAQLTLEVEMNSRILGMAATKVFEMTANDMVASLVRQAHTVLKKDA